MFTGMSNSTWGFRPKIAHCQEVSICLYPPDSILKVCAVRHRWKPAFYRYLGTHWKFFLSWLLTVCLQWVITPITRIRYSSCFCFKYSSSVLYHIQPKIWLNQAGICHYFMSIRIQFEYLALKDSTCLVTLTTKNVIVKYLWLSAKFILTEQCHWFQHFRNVFTFLKWD